MSKRYNFALPPTTRDTVQVCRKRYWDPRPAAAIRADTRELGGNCCESRASAESYCFFFP